MTNMNINRGWYKFPASFYSFQISASRLFSTHTSLRGVKQSTLGEDLIVVSLCVVIRGSNAEEGRGNCFPYLYFYINKKLYIIYIYI